MDLKRILQCLLIIICLIVLSFNVKERVVVPIKNNGKVIFPPNPYDTFNIGICVTDTAVSSTALINGFRDALEDYGTLSNYKFSLKITNSTDEKSAKLAFINYSMKNSDLLYTIGQDALGAALNSTENIPIVMGGVMDHSQFVYEDSSGEITRFFTGVNSMPNMEMVLSTLIEATENIEAVALVFSSEDTESISQLEVLELMLNQAKIPWKEYKVDSASVINDMDGTEVFENSRIPRISGRWSRNPNRVIKTNTQSNDLENDEAPEDADNEETQDEIIDSFTQTISLAATECSSIFIPTGSVLCERASEITDIALSNNTTTITDDINTGLGTLVCTYSDIYDQGYLAGKQAFNILVKDRKPEEIDILNTSWSKSKKLYSPNYANKYRMVFPKSFFNVNTFAFGFKEGSFTKRPNLSNYKDSEELDSEIDANQN